MHQAEKRVVIGLMSGTSLDGVNVAIVECTGSGIELEIHSEAFGLVPYSSELRDALLAVSSDPVSNQEEIRRLDLHLADVYAKAIHAVCDSSGFSVGAAQAIGSHGQTIRHEPAAGYSLQIGAAQGLATQMNMPVVADFRTADIELGGQGAPLVPYMDWALFTSREENRILLNLGGIANITALPEGGDRESVLAFDTGPANMILDDLSRRLFDCSFDKDGALALSGKADEAVVDELLGHSYFLTKPPKSTGRKLFDRAYVEVFLQKTSHLDDRSKMATAASLTCRSISEAIDNFVVFRPSRLMVSGGGVHNAAIMKGLKSSLPGVVVESIAAHGMNPDAKEAICFAILAHEALGGVPTGMPSVTGASGRAFLGKIFHPGT